MRLRTFLTYLSLLPLSACTKSCNEYDNNEEFARAELPAYTETGAGTLGCVLGPQKWTVLGQSPGPGGLGGGSWQPNELLVDGGYSVPPFVNAHGRMTGVLDSKVFYDMALSLHIRPTDTLGGLHLLGADTSRTYSGRLVEQMQAIDFVSGMEYGSLNRRPVRLLVRKLDRQQRIVSGTFAGTLYQYQGPDSLAVTDGRFDVKY
jgi:hypothetical protein